MNTFLLIVILVLVAVISNLILLFRKTTVDLGPVQQSLQSLEQSYERIEIERSVRDEIGRNREEAANAARQSREELAATLKGFNDSLVNSAGEMARLLQKAQLDGTFSRR